MVEESPKDPCISININNVRRVRATTKGLYTFKHINQPIHLDINLDINHIKKKKVRKPENQVTTSKFSLNNHVRYQVLRVTIPNLFFYVIKQRSQ